MPEFGIAIQGMPPVPWGSNEWVWRKAIAEQARAARLRQLTVPSDPDTRFSVTVIFFMTAARIQRVDLYNLAKPVLDTLFHSRRPQVQDMSLTGALFDVDDAQVFELTLKKEAVPGADQEGAQITVAWE